MDPLEKTFGTSDAILTRSTVKADNYRVVFKLGPLYICKGRIDRGLKGGRDVTVYGIKGLGEIVSEDLA